MHISQSDLCQNMQSPKIALKLGMEKFIDLWSSLIQICKDIALKSPESPKIKFNMKFSLSKSPRNFVHEPPKMSKISKTGQNYEDHCIQGYRFNWIL